MKKNVAIIVLAVLMLAAAGVAVYFKIDSKNNESALNDTIEELSARLGSSEGSNTKESKAEEVITEYRNIELNNSNCLNGNGNITYKDVVVEERDVADAMTITRNEDKKSVTIGINVDNLKNYWMIDWKSSNGENYDTINVSNFKNEIVDISLFRTYGGGAAGYDFALFLMKDGTLEYIPIFEALENNDFSSRGTISEVSDIVKLATVSGKNSNDAETDLYVTKVAIKSDGSFYDLKNILNNY